MAGTSTRVSAGRQRRSASNSERVLPALGSADHHRQFLPDHCGIQVRVNTPAHVWIALPVGIRPTECRFAGSQHIQIQLADQRQITVLIKDRGPPLPLHGGLLTRGPARSYPLLTFASRKSRR